MTGRREFVRHIGVACTALAGTCCGGGGESPTSPTPPVSPPRPEPVMLRIPLMPVGRTVAADADDEGLAVTRLSDTSVVAVSRTCTHQGCTVLLPAAPGRSLDCPCHGSRFTTTGAVVNGPAERPLRTYPSRIAGDEVVITLS